MRRQNVGDLPDRHAQPVVKPTGERDDVVAQRRIRHRIGHHRLDMLFAVRAIVAVDRVLRDDRRDRLGNVFDDARSCAVAPLQFARAARTDRKSVLDLRIDDIGRFASLADVADLGTGLPDPPGRGRLLVDRNHRRGSGRRRRRGTRGRKRCRGESNIGAHDDQAQRFGSEQDELINLNLSERPAAKRIDKGVELRMLVSGLPAPGCTRYDAPARIRERESSAAVADG